MNGFLQRGSPTVSADELAGIPDSVDTGATESTTGDSIKGVSLVWLNSFIPGIFI